MKLNRSVGLLLAAVATVGTGAALAAATDTTTPAATTAPAGGHWHHHHGGSMLVGMTLRAAHQLNLTADQQQSIKSILSTAKSQHQQAGAGPAIDMAVLGNPGDPSYATALQSAKSLAATRLQSEAELQSQIYNVLTPDQKAKLPQVLAQMKAKAQARRAAWQQQHGTTAAGSTSSN